MRFLMAFVAGIVLAAGISAEGIAQDKKRLIRLSFSSGWDGLPAIVGIERGFFSDEGLVVSGMPISNSMAAIQSVAVGSSDFAQVPQRTLLVMAGSNLKFGVVSMSGRGAQMELLVPKSDTKTKGLADLKGKRIAVVRGSEAYPVLMRLLNRYRLRPGDVKIARISTGALTRALKEKRADAVLALRQVTLSISQKGEGRVVMSNKAIRKSIGRIGAAPLLVSDQLLQKDKKAVQSFINGWVKSMLYIRARPKDAATLLRIYFHRQGIKVPEKLAAAWIRMVQYDRVTWGKADISDAEYNGWGLVAGKVIPKQPKLAKYIHNEFADKAMKKFRQQANRRSTKGKGRKK